MKKVITENKCFAIAESFKFVIFVYLLLIFISSYTDYLEGYLGGDLFGINYVVDPHDLIIYTLLYSLGLIFSAICSLLLSHLNFSRWRLEFYDNQANFFSVFIILLSAVILIIGGAGTIHRDATASRYSELFVAAFDPMSLNILLIYYVFLTDHRKYRLLLFLFFIYLILVIRSGLTGYLFFCLPLLIFFLQKFFSLSKSKFLLLTFIVFIPMIRFLRWAMIIGLDELKTVRLDYDFFIVLVKGSIDRFSAASNMIYINDNSSNLMFLLDSKYLPFYQGYVGSFFHKLLYDEPVALNTLLLHQFIQNAISDSNSTFPLLSYFSLDFWIGTCVTLYAFIIIFIISRLLILIYGHSILGRQISSYILFIVSFLYVFNGWWWAAVGFIQALIILSLTILIFGKLKRQLN